MIEMRRLENVVIFIQTISSFALSRKVMIDYSSNMNKLFIFLIKIDGC